MRLAERRGVLKGTYLSVVQEWSVEMLSIIDARDKNLEFTNTMRSRLVAAHPESAKSVFPEWYPDDPFAKAKKDDGTYDVDKIDGGSVAWQTPANETEKMELENWISGRMKVGAHELSPEGDWE